MHQPTWSLFDAIRLAGITPTESGMQIVRSFPSAPSRWRCPMSASPTPAPSPAATSSPPVTGPITMAVTPPGGRRWRVDVNGRAVSAARRGGLLTFTMAMRPGRRAGWEITGGV